MFVSMWITLLFTSLIVCGTCGPIDQTSTTNSYDEKETAVSVTPSSIVSEASSQTPKEGRPAVEGTRNERDTESEVVMAFVNSEPHSSNIAKKEVYYSKDDDDDDDDEDDDSNDDHNDDDEDDDERKVFLLMGNEMKRESELEAATSAENSKPLEKIENGEIMEAMSDTTNTQLFGYNPRDKRHDSQRTEGNSMLRRRRQTGETVPYPASNRSRRDTPVVLSYETSTEGREDYTEEPETTSESGESKKGHSN